MSSFELLQNVYLSFLERFLERILYNFSPASVYKQPEKLVSSLFEYF